MDLDGDYYWDAVLGNDANPGTQAQPFQNASVFNNALSIAPGTTINLKRGEVWRQDWMCPAVGGVGNRIVIRPYGSGALPIIDGSDSILGIAGDWSDEGGDVWSRDFSAVGIPPSLVFFDGSIGIREADSGDVDVVDEWYYDTGTDILYVYSTANPATAFTSLEMTQRLCLNLNGMDDWTVEDIRLRKGQNDELVNSSPGGGVYGLGCNRITIQDCVIEDCQGYLIQIRACNTILIDGNVFGDVFDGPGTLLQGDGVMVGDIGEAPWTQCTDVTIRNNTGTYFAGRQGLAVTGVDGLSIVDNVLTITGHDGTFWVLLLEPSDQGGTVNDAAVTGNTFTSQQGHLVGAGAELLATLSNITIGQNTLTATGAALTEARGVQVAGLTGTNVVEENLITDALLGLRAAGDATAIFRYNDVINTTGNNSVGLTFADGDVIEAYGNVFDGFRYGVWTNSMTGSLTFYNNTIANYWLTGIRNVAGALINAENCIVHAAATATADIAVRDDVGTGIYDYMLYWSDKDNDQGRWSWSGSTHTTFAAWKADSGQDGNSPTPANPLFIGRDSHQLWLQSGSPAIDVGDVLADAYQLGLDPDSVWPDVVVLANHNDEGTGWEIGAYIVEFESSSSISSTSSSSSSSSSSPAVDVCPAGKSISIVGPAGSTLAIPV